MKFWKYGLLAVLCACGSSDTMSAPTAPAPANIIGEWIGGSQAGGLRLWVDTMLATTPPVVSGAANAFAASRIGGCTGLVSGTYDADDAGALHFDFTGVGCNGSFTGVAVGDTMIGRVIMDIVISRQPSQHIDTHLKLGKQ